jgi:Base plate wedge protein 53
MKYFNVLPKIVSKDKNNVSTIATNLLARASLIPNVLLDPMTYYQYDIQEGDTPEIIAHKYYGDSYRYWIVLLANKIVDPQWDWPVESRIFDSYVEGKYPNRNIYTSLHHYEKIETFFNKKEVSTNTIRTYLTETAYNNLIPSERTLNFSQGDVVVTTEKRTVNLYTYEYELNESKRTIKLLNEKYVRQVESELKSLMSN